ncbi:MAG: glycosyltransferase family 4 protein [Verrucomicrobiae bacterium]|nr:glycosyltransferase family 4 protein [Verrucomicrobiae bacterium]MDW8308251.1 glycosyltransferase family 4 protein [Verrucomicrobiales bacterium]
MHPEIPPVAEVYRIAIVCSGLDRVRRGFEAYARDLFNLLREVPSFDCWLVKGSGSRGPGEMSVGNIPRNTRLNRLLARVSGKHPLFVEFVSFDLCLTPLLVTRRFDVAYVLEPPVYKFLGLWRRLSRGRFKLIHFTGGHLANLSPRFVTPNDYLHHLTPVFFEAANRLGFRPENQFLLPHFIRLRPETASCDREAMRERVRRELGLSPETRLVLSVGSVDARVKRMDYVVREVATLPGLPFLLILGQREAETPRIEALAAQLLGSNRCRIMTVPREAIFQYYQAADVFVLASTCEAFPLVFLEALAAGLPIVAHDDPVSRYILEQHGIYRDLTRPGELAAALRETLSRVESEETRHGRREHVLKRFSVDALRESYLDMFWRVCRAPWRAASAAALGLLPFWLGLLVGRL